MSRLASRAAAVFPAGSNGEFNLPPDLAIVIRHGLGCELWDDQDRHFYDFSLGWGSALVGHARPEVVDAVRRRAPLGANFAYVTEEIVTFGRRAGAAQPGVRRSAILCLGNRGDDVLPTTCARLYGSACDPQIRRSLSRRQ